MPCAQYWADFVLWEGLLNEQREKPYQAVVELGTFKGGFSLYLAAQARFRGISFRTYDVRAPERDVPGFVRLDIFAHAHDIGQWLGDWESVIVLCDGGNKPRELQTFSRYVTPGSTLVVHDWETEITQADVPDNVRMIHVGFCQHLGSASRVFEVMGG